MKIFLFLLPTIILCSTAHHGRAATTVVTNGTDAELRAAVASCATVLFDFDGVITLTNTITVSCTVTLDATGHTVTLSGGNSNRLFQIESNGNLTLVHLTLANGRSTNGGAVYNEGTVVAQGCGFTNNLAVGMDGANGTNGFKGNNNPDFNLVTPGNPGGGGGQGADAGGGAILNVGYLKLGSCLFENNRTIGGNGGNGGTGGDSGIQYMGAPFREKPAGNGGNPGTGGMALGGSVANQGTLFAQECTFSHSVALGGGGGDGGRGGYWAIVSTPQSTGTVGAVAGPALGAAIYNRSFGLISNCTFVSNNGTGGIGGYGATNIGCCYGPTPAKGGNGGDALGGAVLNASNLIIVNATFATNSVLGGRGGGGGKYPNNNGLASRGGNGGDGWGGALANNGNCQVINLTIQGNNALGGVILTNVVSAGPPPPNGTNGNSFGGCIANTNSLQIVNSILSGGMSNNCFGAITDLGHNISSDATPAWTSGTSSNNLDPLLLPLAENGGPTLTMALRTGSPALNNADPATSPPVDQRGFARPRGAGFDIGAYEGPDAPPLVLLRGESSIHTLRWTAEAGQTYCVDATSDLINWTPFSTNMAGTNGWLELPVPANSPSRFFRLIAQ